MKTVALTLLIFGLLALFVVPFAGSVMLGLGAILAMLAGGSDNDDD